MQETEHGKKTLAKVIAKREREQYVNKRMLDIIHFIDIRDIQHYLQRKFRGEQFTYELECRMKAEEQTLLNELKSTGYEIIDYDAFYQEAYKKAKQEFDMQLKKETAELRHEVSMLGRKLSQVQEAFKQC